MKLTPIYRTPAHVDHYDYGNEGDVEEHYSNVFHRDDPGRVVATFRGPGHREDSQAFCDWCQIRDRQREPCRETMETALAQLQKGDSLSTETYLNDIRSRTT